MSARAEAKGAIGANTGANTRIGIAAGLGAGALWGLVFVAPRMTPGFSALDLAAWRFIFFGFSAALALGLNVARQPARVLRQWAWLTRQQLLAAIGLSVIGFTGYYWLSALSIRNAGSEMPALIMGTVPIALLLLGRPKGLHWKDLLPGLALTALGLLVMGMGALERVRAALAHPELATAAAAAAAGESATQAYWRGIALALLALVSWTAFALLNAKWLRSQPQLSAAQWTNGLGIATGAGGLLLWWLGGTPWRVMTAHPGFAQFMLTGVAVGVGSSWLATVLWNMASQRLSASLCGQLIVSETLFALIYSFLWD
ncbi:MAG: EamA family transporter, partial [Burkholderiaceae bacterium]|nr:EamA family transporter [Burkholderiaceae bacterium]